MVVEYWLIWGIDGVFCRLFKFSRKGDEVVYFLSLLT